MKHLKKFFVLLLCLITLAGLCACNKDDDTNKGNVTNKDVTTTEDVATKENITNKIPVITEEVKVEQVSGFEAKESDGSQIGVIVDSWLKVIGIGEKNGVLSVFVRNISDEDIQYALLSVMTGDGRAEFPISTLTAGASATLRCTNGYVFDEEAVYHSWKVKDKANFNKALSCYPDVFEIDGADGFISIKNISKKNIEGKIYIYYKNITDGVYDDGVTYRAYVDGLKKGEKVQVRTQHYLKDSSHILFVTYAE
ncbi:MAG: hypothetical protein IJA80_07350 [Clostridia bacterium]|nr:hypothetical protein [Clostridia bacterium]